MQEDYIIEFLVIINNYKNQLIIPSFSFFSIVG